MDIEPLDIKGAWLAHSDVIGDERGPFREWFKSKEIEKFTGFNFNCAQGNVSQSTKGTVRGIHYSLSSEGQAKWVTCVSGSIMDFIVDIRPNSQTYGQWIKVELNANSGRSVLIGKNLGHAFISLEEKTIVAYLLDSEYSPEEEFAINPLDLDLAIEWGHEYSTMQFSQKDQLAPSLKEMNFRNKLPMIS
jgi:dTDP-4-dehydrorhamnose 3,5-epimerase